MDKSVGVLLCCWGKVGYGYAAFNIAASIRHHTPDMAITLITDGHAIRQLSDHHKQVFNNIIVTGEVVTDPGGFKTSIYDRLPYDYTLFLDVDGLCIKDINPLMNKMIAEYEQSPEDKFIRTHVYAWYDIESPNDMPMMYWAFRDVIWDHYGFTTERLPGTQSSVQFIAKCDRAEQFYKSLHNTYVNDYIPLESLRHKWGGTQPDELYLNVTIAKFGIDPHIGDVMWFCDNGTKRPHELAQDYYFLSYFGVKQRIKAFFITYYDGELNKMLRQMGYNHAFKSHHIFEDKHAKTFVSPQKAERDKVMREAPLQMLADSQVFYPKVKATINLFTTYYPCANQRRQDELLRCVNANLSNQYISSVTLLSECDVPIEHPKLKVVRTERPTMKAVVEFANTGTTATDINIMCNSDIYMNDTIGMVQEVDLNKVVLCLSRWEELSNGGLKHYSYEYSQDTWLWQGVLTMPGGDYNFGLLGCDNKFAQDVWEAGYKVYNPSFSIKTPHVHLSNVRNYSEQSRLPRPYRNVPVCMLSNIPMIQRKRLLLIQPGKVGDIICCLPIAAWYNEKEYDVEWLCPKQYHEMFSHISYANPVETRTGEYDKVIDLSFGLDHKSPAHAKWIQGRKSGKIDSFVSLKYEIAEVPLSEHRNLKYKRNETNEDYLYNNLINNYGVDYIIVHDSSDYGTAIDVTHALPIVYFEPIQGISIFDWRLAIEKAYEVHCIDSSLANFVDAIKPEHTKLFYYKTDRVPLKADETLLCDKWKRINTLEYAHS